MNIETTTRLHPWTVTVMVDGGEEIYFQSPPANTIGFHRATELTGDKSIYAGDLVVTADGVQIARLSEWVGAYATPSNAFELDITPDTSRLNAAFDEAIGLPPWSPTTPARNYTNPQVQP